MMRRNQLEAGFAQSEAAITRTEQSNAMPKAEQILAGGEMGRLIREKDWSDTPVGSIESWSPTMLAALNIMLASPFPTCMPWGDELTFLYNDAYRPFVSTKHPECLGQSFRQVFAEAWPLVQEEYEGTLFEGKTSFREDVLVPIEVDGKLQDNYWLYSLSPVYEGNRIAGVMNVTQNTTKTVQNARALKANLEKQAMLLELAKQQRDTDDPEAMMQAAAEALGKQLQADRVGFLEHASEPFYKFEANWAAGRLPSLSGTLPFSSVNEAYLAAWHEGITVCVPDTEGNPYSEGSRVVAEGVRARIGVPLLRNGHWQAGLYVHQATVRQWTAWEVGLVQAVGEQTWDAVERARAARGLRSSEARASRILTSIGDAVIVTDADAQITHMNPVAESLTGWAQEEAHGRPLGEIFQIMDEVTREPVESPADKVKRVGTVVGLANHTILTRRDGSEVHIDDSGAPIREDDGKLSGIVLVFRDIGEKRALELERERLLREVQTSFAELDATYQTAGVAMALIDAAELRYMRVNRKLCEMLHLPEEQLVGAKVSEVAVGVHGLDEAMAKARRGEPVVGGVIYGEVTTMPGEKRYWTADYTPVLDAGGKVIAIAAASAEITLQKRAEAALIQNEKLAAVGRLAASIAHEINNPLESVTNLLYLARASEQIEEAHAFLDIAERELRRASLVTNQTLRFYRQSTKPREVVSEDLFEGVLAIYQGRLINSRIQVEKRLRAKRGIRCFEGEIRQVLNNLVGNAIDAMHPAGGRMLIRSREATDWKTGRPGLALTVADCGPGMSEAIASRAFEPFYTTKGISGTGLGLWISQEIATRHEGCLHMRTSQRPGNSGTVFTLFLPFESELQAPPSDPALLEI